MGKTLGSLIGAVLLGTLTLAAINTLVLVKSSENSGAPEIRTVSEYRIIKKGFDSRLNSWDIEIVKKTTTHN